MCRSLVSMTLIVVMMVFLSTLSFAQDHDAGSAQNGGHAMGMKMKDGMKMGHKPMPDKVGGYNHRPVTAESKKNIADMYDKMGACVKTESSIQDCQKKVMKGCPVVAELGYCPLMDGIAPMKEVH